MLHWEKNAARKQSTNIGAAWRPLDTEQGKLTSVSEVLFGKR